MMTKWNLKLRSPAGTPTFGLGSSTTRGTTIDLVWVNEQLEDGLLACIVDSDDFTNHLSDHQSLITSFSTKDVSLTSNTGETHRLKNWNKVVVPTLLTKLMTTLPTTKRLTTQEEIDAFDRNLRNAIMTALDNNSPYKAPPGKHKPWWRPDVLDPLRKDAQMMLKTLKRAKTEENKINYANAPNNFNKKVEKLKEDSWKTYLSTLTHNTLFQAKRFASGRKPSFLVNTLVSKEGNVCSTNTEKADLL